MSLALFGALIVAIALIYLKPLITDKAESPYSPLHIVGIGLEIVVVTVVPMFEMNGLVSMSPSVLITTQAGVLLLFYIRLR